jgi:hypothetical protein
MGGPACSRLLLAIALGAAASASAAQETPPPGAVPIERLMVPKGMTLSPEMRRRIEEDISAGRYRNATQIVWDQTRTVESFGGTPVRVAVDAIVASRKTALESLILVSARAIKVGPFHVRLPAGTDFLVLQDAEGRHYCVDHGGRRFEPYYDERGATYPDACLTGRDENGVFHAIRLIPLADPPNPPRDFAIEPVTLKRSPPPPRPRYGAMFGRTRLRIAAVTATTATILVENILEDGQEPSRPAATATLPLAPGATATLAGVTMRVEADGDGWRVTGTGEIPSDVAMRHVAQSPPDPGVPQEDRPR